MKLKNTLLLLAAIVMISACEERGIFAGGNIISETRSVDSFTSLDISVPANIYISQDATQDLRIETHQDIMSIVETQVIDGELNISFSRSITNLRTLNIYISATDYNRIKLSGAANLRSEGCLNLDELSLSSSGASKIELCGEASILDINFSGASELKGYDMQVQNVKVVASGATSMRVAASDLLDVTASGASRIRYKGNPEIISDISGASTLVKVN